ncbi:alanine--tRNA ligase [Candidatus Parcubacteria bacterium]|nr:alanine--tRNA ligase [Candidatus Parcubacteria bacterium]
MQSAEIRGRFLDFFEKRGHKIIPSSSLVPENDPSVLFTTAGMQPLVPYLLGEKHPKGNRLVSVQKCVRTVDIDAIGDNTHATFFEMLGNWSLGDYFKKEAITWSYEFLTSKNEGLGLDPERLYITVFGGNSDAPKDDESFQIWKSLGVKEERIYFMTADEGGKEPNWWSPGDNGPCGPDSEMFYDVTTKGLGDLTKEEFLAADEKQQIVEIWNDVFMEYVKKDGKVIGKLTKQNVDTGAGLERLSTVIQKVSSIFDTDLFEPIIGIISEFSESGDIRSKRIVADHVRTAVFMISDGVIPSNTDRGYVLRRLIRRAVKNAESMDIDPEHLADIANIVIETYSDVYENLKLDAKKIKREITLEVERFSEALILGLKEFKKIEGGEISGQDAFRLSTTFGLPIDVLQDLAAEYGKKVNMEDFHKAFENHQEISRVGSDKKFKGGLAGHSEQEVKYHTATHMLNTALKKVLGPHVHQKGSNITPERLRFDFTNPEKMTDDQKKAVENIINDEIKKDLPVGFSEMSLDEARAIGAEGVFGEKYADQVKVYTIGDDKKGIFSREICGGPHVSSTGVLGTFKIQKEEAISAGVRRIKAILS